MRPGSNESRHCWKCSFPGAFGFRFRGWLYVCKVVYCGNERADDYVYKLLLNSNGFLVKFMTADDLQDIGMRQRFVLDESVSQPL